VRILLSKFFDRQRQGPDISDLLADEHGNLMATRMALAKHVKEIVLSPGGEGKQIKYSETWRLLGNTECAEGQS
jgi:hypothetical protein